MKTLAWCVAAALLFGLTGVASTAEISAAKSQLEPLIKISGDYLEARTCDVYTGPCFANGEIGLAGREAVLAWKVDQGKWASQDLTGLIAGLVLKSKDTLSLGGCFHAHPGPIKSVILVDAKANSAQQAALVQFVKDSAPHLTKEVVKVEVLEMSLENDHVKSLGKFQAGNLAKIETRKLKKGDCVCSNESVFYPPLISVSNSHPAYTRNMTFDGSGLGVKWRTINKRSAFLATFER